MITRWWVGCAAAAVAATAVVGCSRDLSYPNQPLLGKVVGKIDTQGHVPLQGNTVVLVASDNTRQTQPTDAQGSFGFSGLTPGLYYLDVQIAGFAELIHPNIQIPPGQALDLGTLTPQWLANTPAAAVVTGKVVVQGAASVDLSGGTVDFVLQPVNQRVARSALGADGVFVQTVPPGLYDLHASDPLYVSATLQGVVVDAGVNLDLSGSPLSLALNPATLTGSVAKEVDGAAPIPAANVLVTLQDGTTTTSDIAGNFSVGGLAAGTESVRLALTGYHDAQSHLVTLVPGQTTALPAVTLLLDRGTIAGTVSVSDLTSLAGVTVSLTGTPYSAVPTADPVQPSQGQFQITGVPVGTYEVRATKPNYIPVIASTVPVTADATTTLAQPLVLTPLRGQFNIIGDPTTPGYTRSTTVTLDLSQFTAAAQYRASEDPSFTGVNYQPLTTNQPTFTLTNKQGTHTVYAQYTDASGTQSAVFTSSIVLDSIPPQNPSVAIDNGNAYTNVANPLFLTLQASEPLPTGADTVSGLYQVFINDTGATTAAGVLVATPQPYQTATSFTRSSSANGSDTVYAQFEDHAGNYSAIVQATVSIETVAPTGSLSVARGSAATVNGFTNTPLVTLSEVANPQPYGGALLIKLANSQAALGSAVLQPVNAVSSWFLDPTSDGPKTVYGVLEDQAGNSSVQLTASITLDRQPPSPAAASLVGPATTNTTAITLALNASDTNGLSPTQGVTVSEDPLFQSSGTVGPTAYPASAQIAFTLATGDGPKQVFVRYRDVAGNDATTSVAVTLKRTPPAGTLTVTGTLADGASSTSITSTANVTASITSSGGATGYLLGNESLTICPASGYTALSAPNVTTPYTLSGSTAPRTVALCLIDAAGNTAGPYVQTIALLTTAPAGCAIGLTGSMVKGGPAPAGKTGTPTVTATITGCSATPAQIYLTNGTVSCTPSAPVAWLPFAAAQSFTLAGPDGVNTVNGCVRDAAHNTSALTAGSITLKTAPPSAPRITLDNGAAYVNAAQVTARGGDIASVAGFANGATTWQISEGDPTLATATSFTTNNPQNFTFGGVGARTLNAVFTDDVGNTSAVAQASITFKVAPPSITGVVLSIVSPLNTGFVNSVSATLLLTGTPSDATQIILANAASAAACAPTDFTGVPAQALFGQSLFLLPAGDGAKRVCAELVDAAGNTSSVFSATTTLDTIPPSAPIILTSDQFVSLIDNSPFTVALQGPVTETNFLQFQINGGKVSAWTPSAVPNSGTPTFTFNLTNLGAGGPASGTPNRLRIRAVDQAGNLSPESSVLITADTVVPTAVALNPLWAHNGNGSGILYWPASTSPDVVSYKLYYGSSPGVYTGTYANQGASPILIPVSAGSSSNLSFTLTGLTNRSITYATVVPVDHAGNVGAYPGASFLLQPSQLPADEIASLGLPSAASVVQMASYGDALYALGLYNCVGNNCNPTLNVLDISHLVSPVQGGVPQNPPPPPVVATFTYPEVLANDETQANGGLALVLDDHFLYMTSGALLRIYDVFTPMSPVLVTTIDFSSKVNALVGLAVKGNTLFVQGGTFGAGYYVGAVPISVYPLPLTKLYDHNAGTVPALTDLLPSSAPQTFKPCGGLLWSRNQLLTYQCFGNAIWSWDVSGTLVSGTAPAFIGAYQPKLTPYSMPGLESGDYLYTADNKSVSVTKLNDAWKDTGFTAADILSTTTFTTFGGMDMFGSAAYVTTTTNANGVQRFDLSSAAAPADLGLLQVPSGYPLSTFVHGDYLFVGTNGAMLVYELGTPAALNLQTQIPHAGPFSEVAGGFLYTGASAIDLQSGPYAIGDPAIDQAITTCMQYETRIGDAHVIAAGNTLTVANLENAIDRDPATVVDASQSYTFSLAAGTRATGVDATGNYLVAVEQRSTGTYLEVFDARKVRGRNSALTLGTADSIGSFQVTAVTGTNTGNYQAQPRVTMYRGRAFVSLNEAGASDGIYIVDLRPLLRDAAIGPASALGSELVTGAPSFSGPFQVAVQGNYAYVAGAEGFDIFDVHEAMTEPPTAVPARSSIHINGNFDAVAVSGSYAVLSGRYPSSSATTSVDISTPTTPAVLSSISTSFNLYGCFPAGDPLGVTLGTSISMAAGHVYVTRQSNLDVIGFR